MLFMHFIQERDLATALRKVAEWLDGSTGRTIVAVNTSLLDATEDDGNSFWEVLVFYNKAG